MVGGLNLFLTATKMCDKAVDNYHHALTFVPQKMCDDTVNFYHYHSTIHLSICPWSIRFKKCMIKLLRNVLLHLFVLLIDVK